MRWGCVCRRVIDDEMVNRTRAEIKWTAGLEDSAATASAERRLGLGTWLRNCRTVICEGTPPEPLQSIRRLVCQCRCRGLLSANTFEQGDHWRYSLCTPSPHELAM